MKQEESTDHETSCRPEISQDDRPPHMVTVQRLIAEIREDDEKMTRAPWDTYENRVFHRDNGGTFTMFHVESFEDRIINAAGIARLRNNASAIADQLETLAGELADAERALPGLSVDRRHLTLEDRILELRTEVELARQVLDAANIGQASTLGDRVMLVVKSDELRLRTLTAVAGEAERMRPVVEAAAACCEEETDPTNADEWNRLVAATNTYRAAKAIAAEKPSPSP
jgi:hypothetical protein